MFCTARKGTNPKTVDKQQQQQKMFHFANHL